MKRTKSEEQIDSINQLSAATFFNEDENTTIDISEFNMLKSSSMMFGAEGSNEQQNYTLCSLVDLLDKKEELNAVSKKDFRKRIVAHTDTLSTTYLFSEQTQPGVLDGNNVLSAKLYCCDETSAVQATYYIVGQVIDPDTAYLSGVISSTIKCYQDSSLQNLVPDINGNPILFDKTRSIAYDKNLNCFAAKCWYRNDWYDRLQHFIKNDYLSVDTTHISLPAQVAVPVAAKMFTDASGQDIFAIKLKVDIATQALSAVLATYQIIECLDFHTGQHLGTVLVKTGPFNEGRYLNDPQNLEIHTEGSSTYLYSVHYGNKEGSNSRSSQYKGNIYRIKIGDENGMYYATNVDDIDPSKNTLSVNSKLWDWDVNFRLEKPYISNDKIEMENEFTYRNGYWYVVHGFNKYYAHNILNVAVYKDVKAPNDPDVCVPEYITQINFPIEDLLYYFNNYRTINSKYNKSLVHMQGLGVCNKGIVGFYGGSSTGKYSPTGKAPFEDDMPLARNGVKIVDYNGIYHTDTLVDPAYYKSKYIGMLSAYDSNINIIADPSIYCSYIESEGGAVDGNDNLYTLMYSQRKTYPETYEESLTCNIENKFIDVYSIQMVEEMSIDKKATDLQAGAHFDYALNAVFDSNRLYPAVRILSSDTNPENADPNDIYNIIEEDQNIKERRIFKNIITGEIMHDVFDFIKLMSAIRATKCLVDVTNSNISAICNDLSNTIFSDKQNDRQYLLEITNHFNAGYSTSKNNLSRAVVEVVATRAPMSGHPIGDPATRNLGKKWYVSYCPEYSTAADINLGYDPNHYMLQPAEICCVWETLPDQYGYVGRFQKNSNRPLNCATAAPTRTRKSIHNYIQYPNDALTSFEQISSNWRNRLVSYLSSNVTISGLTSDIPNYDGYEEVLNYNGFLPVACKIFNDLSGNTVFGVSMKPYFKTQPTELSNRLNLIVCFDFDSSNYLGTYVLRFPNNTSTGDRYRETLEIHEISGNLYAFLEDNTENNVLRAFQLSAYQDTNANPIISIDTDTMIFHHNAEPLLPYDDFTISSLKAHNNTTYKDGYWYVLTRYNKFTSRRQTGIAVYKDDPTDRHNLNYVTQINLPIQFGDVSDQFGGYSNVPHEYGWMLPHIQGIGVCDKGIIGFYGGSSAAEHYELSATVDGKEMDIDVSNNKVNDLYVSKNGIRLFNFAGECLTNTLVESKELKKAYMTMLNNYNYTTGAQYDFMYSNDVTFIENEGGCAYRDSIYSLQISKKDPGGRFGIALVDELSMDPAAVDCGLGVNFDFGLNTIFDVNNVYPSVRSLNDSRQYGREFRDVLSGEKIKDVFGFIKLMSTIQATKCLVDITNTNIRYIKYTGDGYGNENNSGFGDLGCSFIVNGSTYESSTAISALSAEESRQYLLEITNHFNPSDGVDDPSNDRCEATVEIKCTTANDANRTNYYGIGKKWFIKFIPAYVIKGTTGRPSIYEWHDAKITQLVELQPTYAVTNINLS